MSQTAIQKILIEQYERRRSQNPSYSKKAFAGKIGLSSGALTSLLKGERRISQKMATRIASQLALSTDELKEFMQTFSKESEPTKKVDLEYVQFQMDHYQLMTEWYHLAILSLVKLEDFEKSSIWIAKRLGITERQAAKAVQRLFQFGYLIEDSGQWLRTAKRWTTSDDIHNISLQKAHKNNLKLAENSLNETPVEMRDITAMTIAIDPAKMSLAKTKIRHFQDEFCELMGDDQPKEVYKLCMQFFPLTKNKDETK